MSALHSRPALQTQSRALRIPCAAAVKQVNQYASESGWLFDAEEFQAHELFADDLPELQAFFVANPEYFLLTNGMPPRVDEAKLEFEERPPAEFRFDHVYVIGFIDYHSQLMAMASVLSNLFASDVWHIGLFIVDRSLHATGVANVLHMHLEQWVKANGAAWLRLGVIEGNTKAERFWEKVGYQEVRRREGMSVGDKTHTIRVMVKPLFAVDIESYLQLVARDRPEPKPEPL